MLHPADAEIVRRDPSLPALATLLDDERLSAILRQSAQGARIREARVEYLRYKPATNCIAGLRLTDAQGHSQFAFAKALPLGSRDWAWQRRRLEKRALDDGGFSALLTEDQALLIAAPEHDRRLNALSQMLLKSRQQLGWRSAAATPGPAPTVPLLLSPPLAVLTEHRRGPARVDCHILRYKPERRFVARLMLEGKTIGVLRACSQPDFAQTLAGMKLGQALGLASLLASDNSHDCLIGTWVEGESLHPQHAQQLPDAHDFRAIGRLLQKLHHTRTSHPVIRQRHADIDAVRQAADTIGLLQPCLADAARALQRRVSDALRQADVSTGLIHGDLSLEQLIRTPSGELQPIDWDSACIGDPAADIGSLLARLCMQHLEGLLPGHSPALALDNILHTYLAQPSAAFIRLIHWHTIAGLMRLMPEGFRKRKADWASTMGRSLQYAIDMADQIDASKALRSTAAAAEQGELWPQNDASQMQPVLAQTLGLPKAAFQLQPVRVLRHKAGRRALLEYVIERPGQPPETLIGKWRHKGVDQNGHAVQRAFWQQGFDMPGLSVPEPVGILPEYRMWLQRKCPGEMYTRQLRPDGSTALAGRIGQAIAALHNQRVPTRRRWILDDELQMLHDRLRKALQLRPIWAERIEALIPAIQQLAARMPANPLTGIHRDCYPDQILVDGDKLVWLDLDLYCEGDPALDAGNFIAHMTEHALRHYHDPQALAPLQAALLRDFRAHSRQAVEAASIEAWTTLSLARHIYLSTQFGDRHHTTAPLLALCEERLGLRPLSSAAAV